MAERAVQDVLADAATVGSQLRLHFQLRRLDGDTLDGLTPAQRAEASQLLGLTGGKGRRLLETLDREAVDRLLSVRSAARPDGGAVTGLGDEFRKTLALLGDRSDVDGETLGRVVARGDGEAVTAVAAALPVVGGRTNWMVSFPGQQTSRHPTPQPERK